MNGISFLCLLIGWLLALVIPPQSVVAGFRGNG